MPSVPDSGPAGKLEKPHQTDVKVKEDLGVGSALVASGGGHRLEGS